MSSVVAAVSGLEFRQVMLLVPVAVALHVLEEWPEFPRWVRRFASPEYSDREYVRVHALTVLLAVGSVVVVWVAPWAWVLFLLAAFVLGPGMFWNAWFHAGASVASGSWCPGAATGLVLYVPLSMWLATRVVGEGVLSGRALGGATAIGLAFHVLEVGHGVFKRW